MAKRKVVPFDEFYYQLKLTLISETSCILIRSINFNFLRNNLNYVSEIRMLILTRGRTRQFMKLFSITFCKIHKIRN
jgi:hypothetical protein